MIDRILIAVFDKLMLAAMMLVCPLALALAVYVVYLLLN